MAGREAWRAIRAAAIATALLWIGLGVFATFSVSTTIVDDSKTYTTIGVVFTLVAWFIAIGAVINLGAVGGAVWHKRRTLPTRPTHSAWWFGVTQRLPGVGPRPHDHPAGQQ